MFSRMAQVGGKGGPSGLAHISELSDGFVGDIHAEFQAGQGALSSTRNVDQIGGSTQIGRFVEGTTFHVLGVLWATSTLNSDQGAPLTVLPLLTIFSQYQNDPCSRTQMLGPVNDTNVEFQAYFVCVTTWDTWLLHHHACLPGSEATTQDRAELRAGRRRTFKGPCLHEFRDGLATQGEFCGSCQYLTYTHYCFCRFPRWPDCARLLTASTGRQLCHAGSFDRLDV